MGGHAQDLAQSLPGRIQGGEGGVITLPSPQILNEAEQALPRQAQKARPRPSPFAAHRIKLLLKLASSGRPSPVKALTAAEGKSRSWLGSGAAGARSLLFRTTMASAPGRLSSSSPRSRGRASRPEAASSVSHTRSASPIRSRLWAIPSASTGSAPSPRRPALSSKRTGSPSKSRSASMKSRVVPGRGETKARARPQKALSRLDLPAFTGPSSRIRLPF